jgi:hypothetical protein
MPWASNVDVSSQLQCWVTVSMFVSRLNRNSAVVVGSSVGRVQLPSNTSLSLPEVTQLNTLAFPTLFNVKEGPVSLRGGPLEPGGSSYCRFHLVISHEWYLSALSAQPIPGSVRLGTSVAVKLMPARLDKSQVRMSSTVVQLSSTSTEPKANAIDL